MYGRCSLNSKVDQSEVANHLDHRTTTFFSDRVESDFDEEPLASIDFDSFYNASVKTATENDVRRQAIIIDDVIVVVVAAINAVVVVIVMN